MSTALKYWDTNQWVFPRPVLEAELDHISSLMQHEGWPVLMSLVTLDIQSAIKTSLDVTRPSVDRDMNAATVKALSWLITLQERVEQLKDCDDPIDVDQDVVDAGDPVDAMKSVMDCVLLRLGVA